MSKPYLDIELYQGEYKDLAQRVTNRIQFALRKPDSGQDYSGEAINRAFSEIGEEVPQIILDAHELLNRHIKAAQGRGENTSLWTGLDRADLMTELLAVGERLSIVYAEWSAIIDQLELLFWPPKDGEGAKLTDEARKKIVKAKLAPYQAVCDIIYYMFVHTAKFAPSTHQSVLMIERELLKTPV